MNVIDSEHQAAIHQELERFLRVAADGEDTSLMPFSLIDEHWHALLSDREAYETFSRKAAGVVVEHQECQGYGELEWVPRYEERYGELPEIWFFSDKGKLDLAALAEYRRTGEWRANWTCGSYIPEEGPPAPYPPRPQPTPGTL